MNFDTADAGATPAAASFDGGVWVPWATSDASGAPGSESASATHESADSSPGATSFDGETYLASGADAGSAHDSGSADAGDSGGGPESGVGRGSSSSSGAGSGSGGNSGSSGGNTGGSNSSGGGGGSSSGGSSGGAGVASACSCPSNRTLFPTGIDCAAIAIDATLPPGQAKKACQGATGFAEATLACGQLGTYVTCDTASNIAGAVRACQRATQVPMFQQCH